MDLVGTTIRVFVHCTVTMTVERYLALMHPFFHQKYATRSRLMIVFLAFQLPEFGIFLYLQLVDNNKYIGPGILLALIVIVFLAICGINVKLFYFARTLRQRMEIPLGSLDDSEQRSDGHTKSKVTLSSLGKISTCLMVVVCLFICYCPFFVVTGMELIKNANETESEDMNIVHLWVGTFLTLNSSLNCLIFFYKNSALRRHAMKELKKCVSCAKARLHC